MGRALGHTAAAVELSERTLRRYVNDGLIRARRVGRQVELAPQEERYLRSHHGLLRALRGALRTERNVQLAVIFGSTATGEDSKESDVDLLVSLHDDRPRSLASLRRRLQTALNRRVHLVVLDDAHEAPSLLADIFAEGRIVVDRDAVWPRLIEKRDLDDGSLTKNERRLATILARLPLAREQLIVAMDEFEPDFDLGAFVAAAQSDDPAERNKVAVIERELDLLINLLEELAAHSLSEARRLGAVDASSRGPWEQLAEEKVIPRSMAEKLREAKDTRNDLDHFYPPTSWKVVHAATSTVLSELDRYVTKVGDWAQGAGINLHETD